MANTCKYRYINKKKESSKIKRRRRWSIFEKLQVVEESKCSNATICSVARKYEISPSLLYLWRRLEKEGKLKVFNARDEVVPVSSVKRLQARIRSLEMVLEKKKKEIEILRSTKPIIHDLEKYPHLKMAIKYNLFGDTNIWISR